MRPKRIIIFGGGHICRELTRLAIGSGFMLTVVDDRQEILDEYKPPVETILTNSDYHEDFPILDENCYVVIITKSHRNDLPVLQQVIDKGCAYVGMIGSKAKVASVYSKLEKAGIEKSLLEKVFAPIGLDIKGEGPYEIALSILAEIIAVKNGAGITLT